MSIFVAMIAKTMLLSGTVQRFKQVFFFFEIFWRYFYKLYHNLVFGIIFLPLWIILDETKHREAQFHLSFLICCHVSCSKDGSIVKYIVPHKSFARIKF